METGWQKYLETMSKEVDEGLAQEFVASLYAQSKGGVEAATRFFYTLGAQWAPLMLFWSEWVKRKAQGEIAIILRDAKPLCALPGTAQWKRLFLNRLVCGVPDELSGDSAGKLNPLLKKYLEQNGCSQGFTFADSGCYGTVVLELHKLGLNFRPLFFFSKNPHIPGFLNEVGLSMEEGEKLNDSLECGFPHLIERPTKLTEEAGKVQVILRPADALSVKFGQAAMSGVASACHHPRTSAQEAAKTLLLLSDKAHAGQFTGVLPRTSKEWALKKEFLASWPTHLHWV